MACGRWRARTQLACVGLRAYCEADLTRASGTTPTNYNPQPNANRNASPIANTGARTTPNAIWAPALISPISWNEAWRRPGPPFSVDPR